MLRALYTRHDDGDADSEMDHDGALRSVSPAASSSAKGLAGKSQAASTSNVAPAVRERRVMPTRLRGAATLLAGSTVEDELNGILVKEDSDQGLLKTTTVLLTTQDVATQPYHFRASEYGMPAQDETRTATLPKESVRVRQPIETPEFRELTDTEVMGKTRSLRSEEDTSDAAYERRHRRPDNVEKRQRRMELENLEKDRQKLRDRIEQLKHADTRMLMDIVTVREQRQRQHLQDIQDERSSVNGPPPTSTEGSASSDLARMEQLRHDLIEEAKATLRRYDVLLAGNDLNEATTLGKRKKHTTQADDTASTSTADDSDVVGGVVSGSSSRNKLGRNASMRIKRATNRGSPMTTSGVSAPRQSRGGIKASASTGSLIESSSIKKPNTKYHRASMSSGNAASGSASRRERSAPAQRSASAGSGLQRSPSQPFQPTDGAVRAEHTYANIHARTSGGRFAPKSALAKLPGVPAGSPPMGSTSRINTKSRSSAGKSRSSASRSPAKLAASPSPLPRGTMSSPTDAKRRPGRPRRTTEEDEDLTKLASGSNRASMASSPTDRTRRQSRRSSIAEADDEPRRRSLKLVLRRTGNNGEGSSRGTSPAPSLRGNVGGSSLARNLEESDHTDYAEEDIKPQMTAALSAEEAQALFLQQMADASSDDGLDADQDARDIAAAASAVKSSS